MAGLETRTREAPMPAKASFQLPSVSVARKPFDFPKVLVCIRADAVSKGYTLSKQSTWSAHKFHDRDANCRQNYSSVIGNFKQKRVRPGSALWASFLGTEMGGSKSNSPVNILRTATLRRITIRQQITIMEQMVNVIAERNFLPIYEIAEKSSQQCFEVTW